MEMDSPCDLKNSGSFPSCKIVTNYYQDEFMEITPLNITTKLPADERRAVTIEAVIALAGSQNPSDITTAAIAKHMNLTQGRCFGTFPARMPSGSR